MLCPPPISGASMTIELAAGTFFGATRGRIDVNGLVFAESVYVPGADIPAHHHAHAFFYLVLEGSCEEVSGQNTTTCGPSSLVFHPVGESHANRWPGRAVGSSTSRFRGRVPTRSASTARFLTSGRSSREER